MRVIELWCESSKGKESGKLFFKKPLWLIITGEKRFELSLQNIFDAYYEYNIFTKPIIG